MTTTSTLTVLGLGPMGQALAGALLDTGLRVTVWNRTEAKARALRERGARWAATPAAAVATSTLTLVNVVDHDAADAVLGAAGQAIADRTIVELSSDTPDRARRTAELVGNHGGDYLDGAIMTPTDTIGSADASILLAGPQTTYDTHRPVLDALGRSSWVGDEYGRAAAFDMALLDLFWTSVGGFQHALMVARANGITPEEFMPHAHGIVGILSPIFAELTERIGNDRHQDSSASVSSVAASVRHLIAASVDAGVDAGLLEAFRGYVDAAVATGHGDDEISRIAQEMATLTKG